MRSCPHTAARHGVAASPRADRPARRGRGFADHRRESESASEIIGPVFLGLVLTVAVHPLRGYLVGSHRWPSWAGTLAAILAAYVILSAVVVALVYAVAQFAGLLPHYQEDLTDLVTSATDAWSRAGLPQQQADAVNQSLDPEQLVATVTSFVSGLVGAASSLFFLFVLLLFMAIDAGQFPGQARR